MIIGIASADYLRADHSTAGHDQWGGAGWARVGQYLDHYRAAGHEVVAGTLWRQGDDGFAIEEAGGKKTFPDVIVMQRIMHDGVGAYTKYAQSLGQVIVNDVDDWYWGLDPNNAAFLGSHPKLNETENTRFYGVNLAASDMVTVSTPYLADRLSRKVRCPIEIIPNYVDVARFTPVTQQAVPTFGWAGSTAHRSGDIETIKGILRPAVERGIKLHHSGQHEESPTFASMIGVPDDMITTTPRCGAVDYPSLLTFDVGLVPLRDTPFNIAKSAIKGLEYAASGIPFIAQALPEYSDLWAEWGGIFHLAKRPADWSRGITRYLNYENRVLDQHSLLDAVKGYDIHYGAARWLAVLEGATSDPRPTARGC